MSMIFWRVAQVLCASIPRSAQASLRAVFTAVGIPSVSFVSFGSQYVSVKVVSLSSHLVCKVPYDTPASFSPVQRDTSVSEASAYGFSSHLSRTTSRLAQSSSPPKAASAPFVKQALSWSAFRAGLEAHKALNGFEPLQIPSRVIGTSANAATATPVLQSVRYGSALQSETFVPLMPFTKVSQAVLAPGVTQSFASCFRAPFTAPSAPCIPSTQLLLKVVAGTTQNAASTSVIGVLVSLRLSSPSLQKEANGLA